MRWTDKNKRWYTDEPGAPPAVAIKDNKASVIHKFIDNTTFGSGNATTAVQFVGLLHILKDFVWMYDE